MKKFLFFAIAGVIILTSCSDDEETSCFDCTIDDTTTEYCHEGDSDTVTVTTEDGESTEISLNGASWSVYKIAAQSACD